MTDRFSHISGSPVLDVINTIHWRLDPALRHDDLASYADVLAWCAEAGLVTGAETRALRRLARVHPERAAAELDEVTEARETAYAALFEDSSDALAALAERYREAVRSARLARHGATYALVDAEVDLATPRHRLVRGLVDLLTREDLDRLHQCEDRACGWVYLDTSPRRNRRWCASSDCGDRNRARAYYARNKQGTERIGRDRR